MISLIGTKCKIRFLHVYKGWGEGATPNVKSLDVFHFFVVLTSDGTNATEQRLCHTDHNQRSSAMVVSCGFRFQKWLYLMNPFVPS